ncbi:MAG: glycosyltransferase family 2 protein [Bacteroidetes bacterium]|nr:glycosyltransferase family 2 protein [Bacteroidota bacterium]
MPYSPQLAVVIPVYNEEASLAGLLKDWQEVIATTGGSYTIILIDDGSKDNSLQLLKSIKTPQLDIHTQTNAGHGPAILKGYHLALNAEWVFQIDSDHQLDTEAFKILWSNRESYDFLLAERTDKNSTKGRRRISAISKLIVTALFGPKIRDVNSPYRLMRATELKKALDKIPADTFAPNILISAWFILKKRPIFTTTVDIRKATTLRQSKVSKYILKGALRSALQTLQFRVRV